MFGRRNRECLLQFFEWLRPFELARVHQTGSVIGKAIVFAREDVVAVGTRTWLGDETVRDIPKPGEPLARGQPICTVFAEGENSGACVEALKRRAHDVYVALEA